jgi:hypothetical protein
MKLTRLLVCALLLVGSGAVASAAPIEKGSSILAFQLTESDAEFISPIEFSGGDEVTAIPHYEMGVQAQFWHLVSEDWALALAAGIGFFKETDESADPTTADFEYTQSSFQARAGLDRFVHLSDTFHLFVGPGLQYWTGSTKYEGGPSALDSESENTNRIALSGRMGAHVKLGDSFGLVGHLGHFWGHASGEDGNAKATWWQSGQDGAAGFAFNF